MVAEEVPAWLSCAECEIAPATLECIDEELLYCAPCSASLHSKRARLHHSLIPFQTCDECEASVARVRCASCAGRQSEPLVFCENCSALLHAKKARLHHRVESISFSCKHGDALQNRCKDDNTEEIHRKAEAFMLTEDAAARRREAAECVCMQFASHCGKQGLCLSREEEGSSLHSKQWPPQSSKQDAPLSSTRDASMQANTLLDGTQLTNSWNISKEGNTEKAALNGGSGDVDALFSTPDAPLQGADPSTIAARSDACEEGSKRTPTEPTSEAVLPGMEVNCMAFMKKAALHNMQEATKQESCSIPVEIVHVARRAPSSSGLAERVPPSDMGTVAPVFTEHVPLTSVPEASLGMQAHNCPSAAAEEAAKISVASVSKEAQLAGATPGMPASRPHVRSVQPPCENDCAHLTPDYHHSCPPFHTQSACQSHYQGPHTPPAFQSNLFPHCTPLIRRHFADNTWPLRAMDFAHSAFHSNQYNAGFMTPGCQSYALVSPPGYMPFSNPYYTGYMPQVDRSSSAYASQRPHEHSQPINERQGPATNKRLWSNLCEVDPMPTSDKGEENASKKMHVGEGSPSANSPNQAYGQGTERTPCKNVHGDSFPKELSKEVEEACVQDASSSEKGRTSSSPREANFEKDSQGKSLEKVLLVNSGDCNELAKASPSIGTGVLPEKPCEKALLSEVLPEKVSAPEPCCKASETAACLSGTVSEQCPDVLVPSMQLDDSLLSSTPAGVVLEKSAPIANGPSGEVLNKKLAVNSTSNEGGPSPNMASDDCIPLKEPSTGLVDKIIPLAHVPTGEVQKEKLVSESLSSEVLSEITPAVTLPVKALFKVPAANFLPKEEPVDLTQGGEELSEFADMFIADKHCPRISLRSKNLGRDLKEINTKEECLLQERNIAFKYPTKRLRKGPRNGALQDSQSPLPDMNKEEENSIGASESSHSDKDTSADDETFNTKKYRRGTITLEATVIKDIVRDASYAITERICANLRQGLRYSSSDDEARQALKNAQQQLTKYNLKQASAFEGCLQNLQALKMGSCVVEFICTGSSRRGRLDCWTYNLAQTVGKYFATDSCVQRLKVVFFGIIQNAYCAGHAFAATYNRIAAFSADYIPEKLLDEGDLVEIDRNWECPNKGVFSRKSRLAYKNELVEGLFNIPKWQRERRAMKSEKVETDTPVHSVWMEGVPKNASLVRKHGYETMEALTIHCRKAAKTFIEKNNWTIVSSKLKDPILW